MATEAKTRRSVQKREKKAQIKEANSKGAVTARLNDHPTSPRKMRLVANLIRGERVDRALNILKFQPQIGAKAVEKLLLSAMANWQEKNEDIGIEEAELYVKEIFVDSGRMLKRFQPAPQGRAHRIRKRSNHVTLTIDSLIDIPSPVTEEKAEKEDKPEKKGKKKTEETASEKPAAKKKAETTKKSADKKEEKKDDNK